MSTADRRARYVSVTAGARVFALLVLAVPVALSQDYTTIVNALLLAAVWASAVFADSARQVPPMVALVVESSLVALIASLALETSALLLPALVVPTFIGGLVRGVRGAFEVLGAEAAICAAATLSYSRIEVTSQLAGSVFTWLMAGLGLGLVAAVMDHRRGEDATTTTYRDARRLIVRLQELSDDLVGGLDPVGISSRVLDACREELPFTGAVVYARSELGFSPLVEGDVTDQGADNAHVLHECFTSAAPVVDGPWVAFPLTTDAGVVAVVAGGLLPTERPSNRELRAQLASLGKHLHGYALQLDTALLFASVRDAATAEERQRLARELHDGVAQDLASLGYLIDDLAETATNAEQAERCTELRTALRRVVAELRRSLFVLRSDPDQVASLGQAVQALASHIGARSPVSIEVTLVEGTRRLRHDVEAELLRIAQEGMTNAVRHSGGAVVEVVVQVSAPDATIVVRDDGHGLGEGRTDSYGIRIMRERARRIGARFELHDRKDRSGTELRLVLDTGSRPPGADLILEGTPS